VDDNRSRRREFMIALCSTTVINVGLGLVPGWLLFIWLLQLLYIVPISVLFFLNKRRHIAAAMYIIAGVTIVLDMAYCGYAASSGGSH
jgi:hypothetical protein